MVFLQQPRYAPRWRDGWFHEWNLGERGIAGQSGGIAREMREATRMICFASFEGRIGAAVTDPLHGAGVSSH